MSPESTLMFQELVYPELATTDLGVLPYPVQLINADIALGVLWVGVNLPVVEGSMIGRHYEVNGRHETKMGDNGLCLLATPAQDYFAPIVNKVEFMVMGQLQKNLSNIQPSFWVCPARALTPLVPRTRTTHCPGDRPPITPLAPSSASNSRPKRSNHDYLAHFLNLSVTTTAPYPKIQSSPPSYPWGHPLLDSFKPFSHGGGGYIARDITSNISHLERQLADLQDQLRTTHAREEEVWKRPSDHSGSMGFFTTLYNVWIGIVSFSVTILLMKWVWNWLSERREKQKLRTLFIQAGPRVNSV